MSTINRLSSVDALQPGDLIPVWDGSNGDTRKASLTTLLAFIESNFADPDYSTRIVAPNVDGFNVDIGNTGDSSWLIVNPVLNYTTGSITLPSTAYAVNDQEITVVFTAQVSSFSITGAGATVLGAPTQIGTYDSFRVRYNAAQLTWYTLDTTGDGSGAGTSSIVRQDFTGDGVVTTFALANAPAALGNELQVFIDGVYQERAGYSVSGNDLVFSEAPPVLSTIEVLAWGVNDIGATTANLVTYTPDGTGAVATTVQDKLRESVSVLDFGAVGDGVADDTAAIQAAHDYAATFTANGMPAVVFPAGRYAITSLTWSPLVRIITDGAAVLESSITTGKGLHVSTEFGSWAVAQENIDYNANQFITGKLILVNTNGRASNTATGVFFGDDGIADFSAESLTMQGLYIRDWEHGRRFGSHAYLLNFIGCEFRDNTNDIYNNLGSYIDRMERITHVACTSSQNVNVINGDAGCGGDIYWTNCSFDYNDQILPALASNMILTCTGLHLEGNSANPFFSPRGTVGCTINLTDYYAAWIGGGSGPNPLIVDVGALSLVRSYGMTALTPTGATLFDVSAVNGTLAMETQYQQLGGAAAAYFTNSAAGYVDYPIQSTGVNTWLIGASLNMAHRATEIYTHKISKPSVAIGASVDLFSVGPVASYATGEITVHSTSSGIITLKVIKFSIIGSGTPGGTAVIVSQDFSGGSAFTITETANSPASGYNKFTLNNTSGVICDFTCSMIINTDSRRPANSAVTLL